MNRVILIGNGFDLAHDMKTSYQHFITSFWQKKKENILSSTDWNNMHVFTYEDEYFEIKSREPRSSLLRKLSNYSKFNWYDCLPSPYIKSVPDNSIYTELVFKNNFLKRISNKQALKDWVDIEIEYYSALLECIDNDEAILKLNEDFRTIKIALLKYLSEECEKNPPQNDFIWNNMFASLEEKDLVLFLNFNYTRTLNSYTYETRGTQTINIHGELNKPDNPIIFGYGDEMDDSYSKLEKINNSGFLEYIKSIRYSLTTNYQDMLSFLESDDFEVYIMGLSCGLSDKTLLNTIFEHQKCKSIRIFYHQKDSVNDNYLETYINISRNFNNKKLLRSIVFPKPKCVALS
ncbi:MAG: bacteriophage abortive infection AbiH family protein [Treponema sp.]|nr:bacteriophage abortive infection AbiH family protein [Treponema sp.]